MRALKSFLVGPKTLVTSLLAIAGTFLITGKSSIVLHEGKWDRTDLTVCFADPNQKKDSRIGEDSKSFPNKPKLVTIKSNEREWIRSIIEQEFRRDRTIITFNGWKDCDSRNPANIWIYMGKGGPNGASNTGQNMEIDNYIVVGPLNDPLEVIPQRHRETVMKPSYIFFKRVDAETRATSHSKLDEENQLKLTALHEFGHAAGLIHENELEEAERDGNCDLGRQKRQLYRTKKTDRTAYSAYDRGSVMNYCFLFAITEASGLRYDVAKASMNPNTMPTQGLPILVWPGLMGVDQNRIVSQVELADRFRMQIRPGLSPADAHALRCLYGPQDQGSQALCNEKTLPHTLN